MILFRYTYVCDGCGKKQKSDEYRAQFGDEPIKPCPPMGWSVFLYGGLYCEDHEVSVKNIGLSFSVAGTGGGKGAAGMLAAATVPTF